jgi:hypothetical protein
MLYLVMEFVQGKSLARSLGGQAIDPAQARSIITAIGKGLTHGHQHRIAHGQLKASHILLTPSAEPKIGNFRSGDFELDSIQDIIDIGKLLFRMLTGTGHSESSPPPSSLVESPKVLDDFCERCIHRDREDAFQTMQEVSDALLPAKSSPSAKKPFRKRAAAVAGSFPRRAAARQLAPAARPGFHWALVRNIIIIAILLLAIQQVLKLTEQKQEDILRIEQAARAKLASQPGPPPTARPLPPKIDSHPNGPSPSESAPSNLSAQSLESLQPALSQGKLEELPAGSLLRGNHAYLPIFKEVSWPEACWFAEQHGAQLASPGSIPDLQWLVSITHGKSFWIGAGRHNKTSWSSLDGKPWPLPSLPSGLGHYASCDRNGMVRAVKGQNRMPFVLHWPLDGSPLVRLESRLSQAARTLSSESPAYPAGTYFAGERAYLIVARESTWEEAKHLATLSGGHLAAVSVTAESVPVLDLAEQLDEDTPYWLGARSQGGRWEWITGETWSHKQLPAATEGTALTISRKGWSSSPATCSLPGFIIEWSRDGNSTQRKQASTSPSDNTSSLSSIDGQAKQIILNAILKRDQQRKENADKMAWDLNALYRSFPSHLQSAWEKRIQELIQLAREASLPDTIMAENENTHKDIRKITHYAISKQKTIDRDFTIATDKIRIAYGKKIKSMLPLAKENPSETQELESRMEAAAEADSWFAFLEIDP